MCYTNDVNPTRRWDKKNLGEGKMKKLISLLLVLVLSLTSVVALVACAGDTSGTTGGTTTGGSTTTETEMSDVEIALAAASEMTLEELEAAAKAEIGDNTFLYARASSTVSSAAAAFATKYGITMSEGTMGTKDSEMATALQTAMDADAYAVDLMVAQNASMVMEFVKSGDLLNFTPYDTTGIADEDLAVLSWIYCTKQFTYTKTNANDPESLYNVWQMTGLGTDGISKFSLQSPLTESINMSWLTMLTADAQVASLEAAYKAYFGTEWSADENYSKYNSIAYYFIAKLLGNVTTWHSSDTSTSESMATYLLDSTSTDGIASGVVGWLPYAKCKDIIEVLEDGGDTDAALLENFVFTGNNSEIEGFSGYAYKMYIQIPRTAKYPYTAALFATYLLSEDGAANSFGSYYGYYSCNTAVESADGMALSEWTGLIYEDASYVYDNYYTVSMFVSALGLGV